MKAVVLAGGFGTRPYSALEPMDFWGDSRKLESALGPAESVQPTDRIEQC